MNADESLVEADEVRAWWPLNGMPWLYDRHMGGHGLAYHLYVPHAQAPLRPLPLVLWLHGGVWTSFSQLSARELRNDSIFWRDQAMTPHYLLRPIARRRENWCSPHAGPRTGSHPLRRRPPPSLGLASSLLDHILAGAHNTSVDRTRLTIAGASMGAYGVWELIQRRPGLFRSAIAICGGGDVAKARLLNTTRIWAFHSADDERVPVNASREMLAAILAARGVPSARTRTRRRYEYLQTSGGTQQRVAAVESWVQTGHGARADRFADLRYTEYVRGGHDAWTRALHDKRLAKWALN